MRVDKFGCLSNGSLPVIRDVEIRFASATFFATYESRILVRSPICCEQFHFKQSLSPTINIPLGDRHVS